MSSHSGNRSSSELPTRKTEGHIVGVRDHKAALRFPFERAIGRHDDPIGQIGAWLIRLPFNVVDSVLGDIKLVDSMTDIGQEHIGRPVNSVTSLRTDNPTLQNVLDSPVRNGVIIHSIMGQKNPDVPKEEGTDGFVAYRSAHLDRAVSELIVPDSNHTSMVHRDETVQEVWRVLRLHAGVK